MLNGCKEGRAKESELEKKKKSKKSRILHWPSTRASTGQPAQTPTRCTCTSSSCVSDTARRRPIEHASVDSPTCPSTRVLHRVDACVDG